MDVNEVRVAEDKDFDLLKIYLNRNDGWSLEYERGKTAVWTRLAPETDFRMIRLRTTFPDVSASVVYDVLHDQDYRSSWDKYTLEIKDIGHLNPNNTIGYYAVSCPSPMKNRDFVLQSSFLETASEYFIINHSVYHSNCPPRKGFVRGLSYFTGFHIKSLNKGCEVGYVTHTNPRGKIPTWLTNKVSSCLAPKLLRKLHKACLAYPEWKKTNGGHHKKHWLYPELMTTPRVNSIDCQPPKDGEEDYRNSSPESLSEDLEHLSLCLDSDNDSDKSGQ